MLGMLSIKEADISTAGITPTIGRGKVISFTNNFVSDKVTIATRTLDSENSNMLGMLTYMDIFSWTLWLCFGLKCLVILIWFKIVFGDGLDSLGWIMLILIQKDPR